MPVHQSGTNLGAAPPLVEGMGYKQALACEQERLDRFPAVVRPAYRAQVAKRGFAAVQQDLHQHGAAVFLFGAEKHHLDIGGHRRQEGPETLNEVVGIGSETAGAFQVHIHHQRHQHVVVPEAEVRSPAALRKSGIGLGNHIVDNGKARRAIRQVLAEALVVVCLPKGCKLLRGQEAGEVQLFILRQTVHAGHKHI